MTTATAGIFTIDYVLRTRADPDADIQFGMDFALTQASTSTPLPLTQLIFPATAVGTNRPGVWNVDNHLAPSPDPACLIFPGAERGTITDKPTELSKRDKGVLTTKFAVYRVDLARNTVQTTGATFGYQIDTGAERPEAVFTGLRTIEMPKEQQNVIREQCPNVKFS